MKRFSIFWSLQWSSLLIFLMIISPKCTVLPSVDWNRTFTFSLWIIFIFFFYTRWSSAYSPWHILVLWDFVTLEHPTEAKSFKENSSYLFYIISWFIWLKCLITKITLPIVHFHSVIGYLGSFVSLPLHTCILTIVDCRTFSISTCWLRSVLRLDLSSSCLTVSVQKSRCILVLFTFVVPS